MNVVRDAHLSMPTVNQILAALQEEGYVTPAGNARPRSGRPPVLYQFNPAVRYAIGVEIKIPRISIGLVDLHRALVRIAEYPFDENATSESVVDTMNRGITEVLNAQQADAGKLVGIGLGVPGFVERDSGVWLRFPRTPQIRDFPLRALLSERFRVPVYIQNEANVCASAELERDPSRSEGDVLVIACFEGLKASVVVDGRVLSGDHGNFGSVGHLIAVENGRLCFCGIRGCLEMYASGYAIRQEVKAQGAAITGIDDSDDPLLPDRIFRLAAEGHPSCREIVQGVVPHMARAFATLIRLTDIDRIILLGAYAEGGDYLRDLLYQEVAPRLPQVLGTGLSIRLGKRLATEDIVVSAAMPAIRGHLGL
jgi:predicted NBD/HSP70 family sugar kinase